jgi:hypothetical protein
MQVDEVAEDVAFQREYEGMAAAFQTLEHVGAAKPFEPHASAR